MRKTDITPPAAVGIDLSLIDRPLKFMSPAERVRLYSEAIQPLLAAKVKLRANHIQPRVILKDGTLLAGDIELTGNAADIDEQLNRCIDAARAQILGGVVA